MNTVQERKGYSISVMEMLTLVKRHLVMILAAGLIGGFLTFTVCSLFVAPVYKASAKMIVNSRVEQSGTVTNDQITSSQKLVDTYAIIIRSQTVLNPVIENLDLPISYARLQKMVSVSSVNGTQVMQIAVEGTDSEMALRIVDEIVKICPVTIMDALEAGSVKVIENAYLQPAPVGPNTNLLTLLATFLCVFVAVAVLVVRFVLDNTYKSDEDLRDDLGFPVLGVIPDLGSCMKLENSKK